MNIYLFFDTGSTGERILAKTANISNSNTGIAIPSAGAKWKTRKSSQMRIETHFFFNNMEIRRIHCVRLSPLAISFRLSSALLR